MCIWIDRSSVTENMSADGPVIRMSHVPSKLIALDVNICLACNACIEHLIRLQDGAFMFVVQEDL